MGTGGVLSGGMIFLSCKWNGRARRSSRYLTSYIPVSRISKSSTLQLAQWAGSRVDLFPSLLCQRLGRLHSEGKSHPFWYTKQVLERIFKRPLDQIFEQIDETPIGSGAIAQVHSTKMLNHCGRLIHL